MSKINLFFEIFQDPHIAFHKIIRLKCGLQLKNKERWSQPYAGIIDTGAHLSIIPFSLWQELAYEHIQEYQVFGLSKKEECSLKGKIGRITAILIDEEGNQTSELVVYAFLANTDQIPLIIGFNGFLENINVTFNSKNRKAYLE